MHVLPLAELPDATLCAQCVVIQDCDWYGKWRQKSNCEVYQWGLLLFIFFSLSLSFCEEHDKHPMPLDNGNWNAKQRICFDLTIDMCAYRGKNFYVLFLYYLTLFYSKAAIWIYCGLLKFCSELYFFIFMCRYLRILMICFITLKFWNNYY